MVDMLKEITMPIFQALRRHHPSELYLRKSTKASADNTKRCYLILSSVAIVGPGHEKRNLNASLPKQRVTISLSSRGKKRVMFRV